MKFKINFLIIIVILVVVAFGFRYYQPTLQEKSESQLIPDTNYTCADITPENLTLSLRLDMKTLYFGEDSVTNNGIRLRGDCKYNTEVGTNINQFNCGSSYTIRDRITEDGIKQKDYAVSFDMLFDVRNCTQISEKVNCNVLESSCSWKDV